MAFMFSRAAWADLKGKKAAKLTMLLNFPRLSTLASTWHKSTIISALLKEHKTDSTQELGKGTHLGQQHADLLHFFDGE